MVTVAICVLCRAVDFDDLDQQVRRLQIQAVGGAMAEAARYFGACAGKLQQDSKGIGPHTASVTAAVLLIAQEYLQARTDEIAGRT